MRVEIVDVNSCKRNLIVEVPAEQVEEEIHKLAQKYAQRAKVPGFRPGKTPLSIIKQRFASELRSDATQDLISRYWKNAVSDHQLHPLAEPVVEHLEAKPGNPLKFTVSFEILPQLEVKDYTGITIPLPSPTVEETDVDKALEELREQSAEFVPVEHDEIRDGHVVTLTVDGEFEEGGKPLHEDDVVCAVGDPHTNEAFSENLRGAHVGQERAFEATYPADYESKRFAGKKVRYRVLIKDVKEKQLPELNDDFARDLAGHEGIAALRAKIRDELITKAKGTAEKKAREAILDQVVGRHSFDIPESMIRDELEDHARQIAARLARQGIDVNKTSIDWRKVFNEDRPRAEQAVRRLLVLDSIARQEHLEVTEEELDEELLKLAEGIKKSPAALRAQMEKDKRIQGFQEHLRQKKALDFIFRNANITGG